MLGGKISGHKLLQLLRLFSCTVTTHDACQAFAEAGGVPWLKMVSYVLTEKKPFSPTLLAQAATLVANVLSFGDLTHALWTAAPENSIYSIVAMLSYDKSLSIQKDGAKAFLHILPLFVERHAVVFGKGLFKALIKVLDRNFEEFPLKDILLLQLYVIRSMVLIGIGCKKRGLFKVNGSILFLLLFV